MSISVYLEMPNLLRIEGIVRRFIMHKRGRRLNTKCHSEFVHLTVEKDISVTRMKFETQVVNKRTPQKCYVHSNHITMGFESELITIQNKQ